ncbi:hypothetical protein D4764_08G0009530 [Takifugu flavidus]|uniref:Uncharacterized protein n=1 Tax=Takifugu flavidus TaxID=433684 RepID=A0A5C6MPA5_9TELE|nr:hypothetical protein D4764_08G0009530 [Takifugu flavidus]
MCPFCTVTTTTTTTTTSTTTTTTTNNTTRASGVPSSAALGSVSQMCPVMSWLLCLCLWVSMSAVQLCQATFYDTIQQHPGLRPGRTTVHMIEKSVIWPCASPIRPPLLTTSSLPKLPNRGLIPEPGQHGSAIDAGASIVI